MNHICQDFVFSLNADADICGYTPSISTPTSNKIM